MAVVAPQAHFAEGDAVIEKLQAISRWVISIFSALIESAPAKWVTTGKSGRSRTAWTG